MKTNKRWVIVSPEGYVVENILEISPSWAKTVFLGIKNSNFREADEERWQSRYAANGYRCVPITIRIKPEAVSK